MSVCLPRPAPLRVRASVAAILLVLLGAFDFVRADTLWGRVYVFDARVGSVLFTWELERDLTTGHWRSAYRTLEGTLAAEHELVQHGVTHGELLASPIDGELVLHSGGG